MIDTLKGWIEDKFTGEVINDTNYYLYVRTENDKVPVSSDDLKHFVTIQANSTLVESLDGMRIPIDGIVFPDGSIYKGWSGSKVTVTEKNGNIDVKQSVGTAIANGIANIGKFVGEPRYAAIIEDYNSNTEVYMSTPSVDETVNMAKSFKFK